MCGVSPRVEILQLLWAAINDSQWKSSVPKLCVNEAQGSREQLLSMFPVTRDKTQGNC